MENKDKLITIMMYMGKIRYLMCRNFTSTLYYSVSITLCNLVNSFQHASISFSLFSLYLMIGIGSQLLLSVDTLDKFPELREAKRKLET